MPKKLSKRELCGLKDLGHSGEDLRELHKTLSEMAVTQRYERALAAAGSTKRKEIKNDKSVEEIISNFDPDISEGSNDEKNQILSSGDTEKIDKNHKRIQFSEVVEVVYFNNKTDASLRRSREPLADENDQQSRSYRKRFMPPQSDEELLNMCQRLVASPTMRHTRGCGFLNFKDPMLIKLERELVMKKRKPLSEILK